jgi:hypothetical protein
VFFYFVPLYIVLLGLGWFICKRWWRLRGRDEALLFFLLAVWGLWGGELFSLLPKHILSPDGIQVLGIATSGCIIASAMGGLVHVCWPASKTKTLVNLRPVYAKWL